MSQHIRNRPPGPQGLYDPAQEHDACGVGFVAHLGNQKSNTLIAQAAEILVNLEHRGACGCEENTGDGAGMLFQMPHKFLEKACAKEKIKLPAFEEYGVGMFFLPPKPESAKACEAIVEKMVAEEGHTLIGWRTVPTDNSTLGPSATACEPLMRQVVVGRASSITDPDAWERKLWVLRHRIENEVKASSIEDKELFTSRAFPTRRSATRGCSSRPS